MTDPHHAKDEPRLTESGDVHALPSSDTRDLAHRVADFLSKSGYLDVHDAGQSCELRLAVNKGGRIITIGQGVFASLLDSLDELYPEWRTLDSNYRKERDA